MLGGFTVKLSNGIIQELPPSTHTPSMSSPARSLTPAGPAKMVASPISANSSNPPSALYSQAQVQQQTNSTSERSTPLPETVVANMGPVIEDDDEEVNPMGRRNVYISGLPSHFRSNDFRELCQQFGRVEASKLCVDNRKGYGFSLFYKEEAAEKCIRELNGTFLFGRCLQARHADASALPQPVTTDRVDAHPPIQRDALSRRHYRQVAQLGRLGIGPQADQSLLPLPPPPGHPALYPGGPIPIAGGPTAPPPPLPPPTMHAAAMQPQLHFMSAPGGGGGGYPAAAPTPTPAAIGQPYAFQHPPPMMPMQPHGQPQVQGHGGPLMFYTTAPAGSPPPPPQHHHLTHGAPVGGTPTMLQMAPMPISLHQQTQPYIFAAQPGMPSAESVTPNTIGTPQTVLLMDPVTGQTFTQQIITL